MANATFHSIRGEKSALILIKANAFEFSATPVYVPRQAVMETLGAKDSDDLETMGGSTFEIPDGFSLVDMVDGETGEVRTANNGEPLQMLKY